MELLIFEAILSEDPKEVAGKFVPSIRPSEPKTLVGPEGLSCVSRLVRKEDVKPTKPSTTNVLAVNRGERSRSKRQSSRSCYDPRTEKTAHDITAPLPTSIFNSFGCLDACVC